MKNNSSLINVKILSQLTRNLILNSKNIEIFRLEEILKESGKPIEQRIVVLSKEEIKKRIKEKVKEKLNKPPKEIFNKNIFKMNPSKRFDETISAMIPQTRRINENGKLRSDLKIPRKILRIPRRILKIPTLRLPERLQYLKPKISQQRIDLGKLNNLIQDSNVLTIETKGDKEKIFVSGKMGKKSTNIILSKEEISDIINKFATKAKIPLNEGLFTAVVGNLILTAVISESISSRFILKKIMNKSPLQNQTLTPRPN